MKKLLNTLYLTSPDHYLSLEGENVVVLDGEDIAGRVPLHNLESIVSFGYRGASPALMGACAERGIALCFLTPQGRFLARVTGKVRGNVILRKNQFEAAGDAAMCCRIARNFILGKVYNSRWVLERLLRDHEMQIDADRVSRVSQNLQQTLPRIRTCTDPAELRGLEGEAASRYFSVFNEMILQQKSGFHFDGRNRRPPLDRVNALLSFSYTLLTGMVTSSLESVGLDPYVGFLHTDRPGRASLSLDLMEELRPVLADRFVLTLINRNIVSAKDFSVQENGAVLMKEDARKRILTEWQNKKKEAIRHPFLDEKVEWGMVPFAQAMLLARYLRGDLDEYPPLLWK